jgi:hypothetical protein
MANEQPDYLSYLLRLWREDDEGQTAWRASLERSRTAKRQVFPSLDDLFEHLQQRTGAVLDADVNGDKATTGRWEPHKPPTLPV